MYIIYSYWDMAEIQAVLNAVVMVTGGNDFASLLRVFALIGLFIAVTYGFVRARGEDAAAYLIIVAIWYVGLFVPKVNVTIEDRAPATGAPVQVANVPLGLAFFASTTSQIGDWLTRTFETNFSMPDDLRFDRNGMMFGSRILEEMRRSTISDPTLTQDITNFVKNCLNPEMLVNPSLMNDIMKETNLWQFIVDGAAGGMFNPGLAVTVYSPSLGSSRWVTCKDVVSGGGGFAPADSLNARLTASINEEQSRLARFLNPGRTAVSANALIATQLTAAESLMLGTSRSAVEGIRQNMMINLMRDTSKTIPQLLNDPAAVQIATAESMAAASSNSSYLVMAKMAEGALPKIRNVIHLVILAVFPIIMVLLIMAGTKGGLVLKSYGITLLWIQLWAPLYAVVNYISSMAAAKSGISALAGLDGQTLGTAAQLATTVISDQAVAGLLSIAVPIMALALVKGGEVAMSGVVSSVMGPAQSAASRAGDSVGQGNISMGNTSWGTHTSNMMGMGKADTNMAYNSGAFSLGRGLGTQRWDSEGAQSFDGSALGSNLGKVGGMLKSAVSKSAAEQATQSWSHGLDASQSFASSFQAALTSAKAAESSSGFSSKAGMSETLSAATRISDAAKTMDSVVNDVSKGSGVDRAVLSNLAYQFKAGAGVDTPILKAQLGASLSSSGMRQDQVKTTLDAAEKVANSRDFSSSYDIARSAMKEATDSKENTSGNKNLQSLQAQSSNSLRAESSAAESFRKAESFDRVQREMASGDRSVDIGLASAFVDKNGSAAADRLARLPASEQGVELQKFAEQYAAGEAQAFMAYGGEKQLSPTGVSQESKGVADSVDRETAGVANAVDSGAAAVAQRATENASKISSPAGPPQSYANNMPFTSGQLSQGAQAAINDNRDLSADRFEALVNQREALAGQATRPGMAVNALAVANNALGFITGAGPIDLKEELDPRRVYETGLSWRPNGRGDEGVVDDPSKPPKE